MNFNSQICTTVEQSQRLLGLGLKKETADMYLQSVLNDEWSPFVPIAFTYSNRPEEIIAKDVVNAIPAWSLHRLIELAYGNWKEDIAPIYLGNSYDMLIGRIEFQIKCGRFPKEYLEE